MPADDTAGPAPVRARAAADTLAARLATAGRRLAELLPRAVPPPPAAALPGAGGPAWHPAARPPAAPWRRSAAPPAPGAWRPAPGPRPLPGPAPRRPGPAARPEPHAPPPGSAPPPAPR
ncbi:hypothetical protein AB0B42_16440 [Streptomyces fradiae]|uniref:hypothetical protein n=1 Tax=Streptomyces fradiae TaxID=1906 RepID=UPI0033CF7B22